MALRMAARACSRGSTAAREKKQVCMIVLIRPPSPSSRARAEALMAKTRSCFAPICRRIASGRRSQISAASQGLFSSRVPPGRAASSRSKRPMKSHWWQATRWARCTW